MNAIIFLNYKNDSVATLGSNILNAGTDIEQIIIVKEKGISNAINIGLRQINFDVIKFVTILANDIYEPDNWLLIRNEFMQDKQIGICSIPVNGFADDTSDLVGNFTISSEVIKKVGAFNEELDPYGAIDLDYCTRVRVAGYYTKFIKNYLANQIEKNYNHNYGFDKLELVNATWGLHSKNVNDYQSGSKNYYISL